jgi:hypothetical protein
VWQRMRCSTCTVHCMCMPKCQPLPTHCHIEKYAALQVGPAEVGKHEKSHGCTHVVRSRGTAHSIPRTCRATEYNVKGTLFVAKHKK